MKKDIVAKIAKDYAVNFKGLKKILVRHRPKICPFEDILPFIPKGASIFDIGCGSGFLLYAHGMINKPRVISGVEVERQSADYTAEILHRYFPEIQIEILCTKLLENWPDDQFDVVTMIDVLHHIPPVLQHKFFIAAAARVKPGGLFIYKDIAETPVFYSITNRVHDLIFARQWVNYFPIEKLKVTLLDSGFENIGQITRTMYWYKHELIVFTRK